MKKPISNSKKLISKKAKTAKSIISIEHLHHFRCGSCNKWWSIGDPSVADSTDSSKSSATKREWFCPWCGIKNSFKEIRETKRKF